ncbi:MAG: nicotinate-nicotinamide nucleotide adenylyltransferase [Gaiellaceae bacterium]
MTGLFGGAFDPPHNGHVELALAALHRFKLDPLLVLVVAAPGHKPVETDVEARLELARAAFADLPGTEVRREDHAFTIDSVRDGAYDDALFLVGADEFADFLSWKEPREVLQHVRLAVATRPGFPRERLEPVLAELGLSDRVELFEIAAVPVSSTQVRNRVRNGQPIDELVPPAVAVAIDRLGLYR